MTGPRRDAIASIDFVQVLKATSQAVEDELARLVPASQALHGRIHEAMRYAVFAGGKRLRPFLVQQSAGLFGVDTVCALRVGAAIECLHTYSLVHDDLPCMDDDDLRRGRPTTHRAFDEATAVLAGDALLTVAFEILAGEATHPAAAVRCRLVEELATAAGRDGMIGGQMVDMLAAQRSFGADEIILLQRMKTGALFEFCCTAGAILGQAGAAEILRLREYARDIGLIFQITDDLLDVLSTADRTGKAVGKDAAAGKATLVSLWGVAAARTKAAELADHAIALMDPYGPSATELRALPRFLLERDS
ncbi:MAG: polyprenyl synthetase family protein [Alphaproteobacteria bacterium]|nr:polyprenyl synthetase family protein [Alphaproteobacteria bacterium]